MIIGACGFTGTGSSAITDYLKEFTTVSVVDHLEFLLAHSPDGLEDLDFQLNRHCCKYTASEVATKRFRMNIENYLVPYLKTLDEVEKVRQLTEDYLNSIIQVRWQGFGSADFQIKSDKMSKFMFRFGKKILSYMPDDKRENWTYFPAHMMEFSIQPEYFYDKTRAYVHEILVVLGADFNKTVALNQPFSGTIPQYAFPYFDDPYAVIVDRDPRDLYTIARKYYHRKGKAYQIPTDTVENFVEYFRNMRELYNPLEADQRRILRIQFEDMVYEYDKTTALINEFCHVNPKDRNRKIFDPNMSINNTQVFKRFYSDVREEIAYIEKELGNYLFDFEKYKTQEITGAMFLDSSPLNK